MRRGGLGRGLSALIPSGDGATTGSIVDVSGTGATEVPVHLVSPNPSQPRRGFDPAGIDELARSITEVGMLQPILVRRQGDGFELIAGERRLRAARLAGLTTVPAVIRDTSERGTLREALIENTQRADLSALELAAAFDELAGELGGLDAAAEALGHSRSHVSNTVRLLSLPADVQGLLARDAIQAGHARALLGLPDPGAMSALALRTAAEGLSVRQVEELVRAYAGTSARRPRRSRAVRDAGLAEVEERLTDALGTRVRVSGAPARGRIVIEFASREDLSRIVRAVAPAPAR